MPQDDPHDMTLHMLGTGADRYRLVVDVEVGVLLRSEAEFGGEVFRIIEADAIGINEEFSANTFDGERLRTGELRLGERCEWRGTSAQRRKVGEAWGGRLRTQARVYEIRMAVLPE